MTFLIKLKGIMSTDSDKKNEIIFFLGAGASVKAGVPDTYGLVKRFKTSIADQKENSQTLSKIISILTKWRKEQGENKIDIELLLESLEKLESRDKEVLLKFYGLKNYKLSNYSDKNPLINELKDYIKSVGIVNNTKIHYLKPFLTFMVNVKPLDIFTVNYDICIEQFCNTYNKSYVDGFQFKWDPQLFLKEDIDCRLYKLHGSIMWYKTDLGDYVKIHTKTTKSHTEMITGEKAETLMLYPMRKWGYNEPSLELLIELKKKLEHTNFVFVVGYSFRDDHIRSIFWDAARKNRNLILILIGPQSRDIYLNRLKYYDSPTISEKMSSSLFGRTICIPYKFESVFPILNNRYFRNLSNGIRIESQYNQAEILEQRQTWEDPIRIFIDCNYMEKVEEILEKKDIDFYFKNNYPNIINFCCNSILNYIGLSDEKNVLKWYNRFCTYFLINPIYINLNLDTKIIKAGFKINDGSVIMLSPIYNTTNMTSQLLKFTKAHIDISLQKKFGKYLEIIEKILDYMYFWRQDIMDRVTFSEYIGKYSKKYSEKLIPLNKEITTIRSGRTDETKNNLTSIVEDIEKNELLDIFKFINT